jgi:hypothetical protein
MSTIGIQLPMVVLILIRGADCSIGRRTTVALSKQNETQMRLATHHAVTVRQEGRLIIFHETDMVKKLMDLHVVMEQVIGSRTVLFKWRPSDDRIFVHWTHPEGTTVAKSLATKLLAKLPFGVLGYKREFFSHRLHPLLELLGKYADSISDLAGDHTKDSTIRLNGLIDEMRNEARTPAFRRKRDAHLRCSRDATRDMRDLVDELFQRVSRTLVVRLDLSYKIDTTMFTSCAAGRISDRVSEQQARMHRDKLIRYLKRKFRIPLLTYAWKEELGRFTSYHYHLLLFFDGNASRSGYIVGNEIGQYWTEVITDKRGRFHNCAYDKHVESGINLINHWEVEKIAALKEIVIPYITKSDYFIRLVAKGRIFGKGKLPPKPQPGRGRPRKRVELLSSEQIR